jgi:transposase
MSSIPVFVGLDYHQQSVQVCVLDEEGRVLANRRVINDEAAVWAAATRHGQPTRVAIEACCGAADLAEELVTQRGLSVALAHPGYVARMKRGPDKTDFADARLLADLARVNYLPRVWLAPEETRQLRRLVRLRQQLVARRRDVKLRITGLLRENRVRRPNDLSSWTKGWLAWLERQAELSESDRWILEQHLLELRQLGERIAAVEKRLLVQTADDPIVTRLLTLAGVGPVTAITLRAEIGRFDRFGNGKELARFCGITPRNASTGQKQADAGLVKAGNPQLRALLVELAHRLLMRPDAQWGPLAGRLLSHGKPKNVVVAAVANRWTRWLYYQMRSIEPAPTSVPARQKGPPLPPSPSLDLT